MDRSRSLSAETLRRQQPVAGSHLPASDAEVNRLGIRILGLKAIPVKEGARLAALLDCASALKRLPPQHLPLLAEELMDACATLPSEQEVHALQAIFAFRKMPTWSA